MYRVYSQVGLVEVLDESFADTSRAADRHRTRNKANPLGAIFS